MKAKHAGSSWLRREPFLSLPAPVVRNLAAQAQPFELPKETVLFREGEPAQVLWIIQTGWVRLTRGMFTGKRLMLDIVTPAEMFCGLSAATGTPRYMATAVTACPAEAVRLPAAAVRKEAESCSKLAFHLAQLLNQRYFHTVVSYAQAFAPAHHRIAYTLLRLAKDLGKEIPITRREVAELSGTTVETAIRVTRKMERADLLRLRRGKIRLLKADLLDGGS